MGIGTTKPGDDLMLGTFRIWPAVWKRLQEVGRDRGQSVSNILRCLVLEFLEDAERKDEPETSIALRIQPGEFVE